MAGYVGSQHDAVGSIEPYRHGEGDLWAGQDMADVELMCEELDLFDSLMDEDLGIDAKTACAKLLLIGEESFDCPDGGKSLYFVVLGPTHPPEGSSSKSDVYERLACWRFHNFRGNKVVYDFQRRDQEVVMV
ncbi:hypothetical protein LTR56_024011 [Elasticomyces elasticus]|nr:hypothetical protein LTR56_024011 [Elasticomyces elasticus]KAK3661025.1 hypothetical protein LTR22_007651 [Elasticomyces elasticus]KAK4906136.1 hypothetical protein LTR49_024686 [Elasticomyces elasticus]KAK5744270.1 hypothetical protein LTS12_023542 [Elasticomyces elasticus]